LPSPLKSPTTTPKVLVPTRKSLGLLNNPVEGVEPVGTVWEGALVGTTARKASVAAVNSNELAEFLFIGL
jgi:hypothetical protein